MISVIIPVYNCEKYINRCVESILKQSYKEFELILVNDGSTDSSGEICEELKSHDDRIQVIHKVNGGTSSARNAGLNIAQGEYIAFVDADDCVEFNYLEELSKPLLYKENIDIVVMPWGKYNAFSEFMRSTEGICYIEKKNACIQLFQIKNWGGWVVWSKLYRRSLFQDVLFRKDLCIGEDLVINIELFWKANSFYYVPYNLYSHCLDNANSLTHRFVLDNMLVFLRVLSNYVLIEEERIVSTFPSFYCVVADFYIETVKKMIIGGIDEEKSFHRLAEVMDDTLVYVFNRVPKTLLNMLKREFYANPSKCVYDSYVEMLNFLKNKKNERGRLYIYGYGKKAKCIADFFKRKNIQFDSFIVSDGHKIGSSSDIRHSVINISKLLASVEPADVSIFLAMKDEFAEEVLQMLSAYKFKKIFYL